MSGFQKSPAVFEGKIRGDKKRRARAAEACQEKLILINHEILIQDGDRHAGFAGRADELIPSAKVFFIGEDGERGGAVFLIVRRYHLGAAFFFDPAFGRGAAFELGDDAAGGVTKRAGHGRHGGVEHLFYTAMDLTRTQLLFELFDFHAFVGDDLFQYVGHYELS